MRAQFVTFGTLAVLATLSACIDGDAPATGESSRPSASHVLVEARRGPLGVVVKTDTPEPRFGDRLRIEVVIDAGPGVVVRPVEFPGRMGHLLRAGRDDPATDEEGPIIYGLLVQPERTGVNIGKLPSVVFEIGAGEGAGKVEVLEIPSFELSVAGLADDQRPALADVGDPLPPVPLPARDRGMLTLWVAIGGAGVLLLLTGFVWWSRRRPVVRPPPPIDPVEEARRALEELLGRGLVEAAAFGEFYVGLTGIVRTFIERTTGVHAPEETTEEFLRDVEHNPEFPIARREALQRFLESADLVKYAAQVPGGDEIAEAVDRTAAFCELGSRFAADGVRTPEVAR